MANACFRCKTGIDSGRTFCADCRQVVDLEFDYTRESRSWVLVALLALLEVLLLASALGAVALGAVDVVNGVAIGVMPHYAFSLAFCYALYVDARHVDRRDDTDWAPSKWRYAGLVLVGWFVPLSPVLIGAWYLHKRRSTIGLSLRRSSTAN